MYILVEHQSRPDKQLPFRVVKYLVNLLEKYVKEDNEKLLPLVYPIIFYHGKQTPYPYTTNFYEQFVAPNIAKEIFPGDIQLVDVGQIEDEILKKQLWTGLMEYVAKHIYARDIADYLTDISREMSKIEAYSQGIMFIELVAHYVYNSSNNNQSPEQFTQALSAHLSAEGGSKIMSPAQQFINLGIERGIEQGIEQGIEKGMLQVAKRMIATGDEVEHISSVTGLSEDVICQLRPIRH